MSYSNEECKKIIEAELKSDGLLLCSMINALADKYRLSIYGTRNRSPIDELSERLYEVSEKISHYELVLPPIEHRHESPFENIVREMHETQQGEKFIKKKLIPFDLYHELLAYINIIKNQLDIDDPILTNPEDKDISVMRTEHLELISIAKLIKKTASEKLAEIKKLWEATYN